MSAKITDDPCVVCGDEHESTVPCPILDSPRAIWESLTPAQRSSLAAHISAGFDYRLSVADAKAFIRLGLCTRKPDPNATSYTVRILTRVTDLGRAVAAAGRGSKP